MEDDIVLYEAKPRFNFIYELFMPQGRKIRMSVILFLLFLFVYVVFIKIEGYAKLESELLKFTSIDLYNIFNNIYIFIIIAMAINVIAHIVIHVWQYSAIRYKFYKEYLEYSDMFLNQQKKTIRYENIREIEIRKSVWDRINGYGTIIVYTNAEKNYNNGLVLYSMKNAKKIYDDIDKIVHSKEIPGTHTQSVNND